MFVTRAIDHVSQAPNVHPTQDCSLQIDSLAFAEMALLPLSNLLILPKLPQRPPNIPTRQKHRRLRPLIHRLRPPMLRHVRIHITRTAAINQHPTAPLPLLQRSSPCHTRNATLAHGICRTGPALLLLLSLFYSFGEGFHERGDVVDGLGFGEGGADFGRVFGIQVAYHAGYIHQTTAGADQREERARGG